MASNPPIDDFKNTAGKAKGAVQAVNKAKTAIRVVKTAGQVGTGPVGWLAAAAQVLPISTIRRWAQRAAIAGIAAILALLAWMWVKILGLLSGLAFGAITGLPLLLVPGVGPFLYAGWVAYWGYHGFIDPIGTIHLATHPWEPLQTGWSYAKGGIESLTGSTGSTIGSFLEGALSTSAHFVTGLASTAWGGIVSAGGSLLGGAINLASSIWGSLTGATGALAGQIAAIAVGTTIASAATLAILNAGVLTPGKFATTQTDRAQNIIPPPGSAYLTVTKTATPTTLQNSDLPKTINFEVIVSTKSVKIVNVTCEDLTTLVKSDGSTVPLTVTPTPSCPSTIDANSQVKFNFTTQAENTPAFQDASIVNVFNIYYDIEQLALGNCATSSGFSNLLPNPIPPSAGAVSPSIFSRLNAGQVVPAAVYGAQKSGVSCELLVGIDYVEASWYDDGSFISGRKIGDPEPDVPSAGSCTAYGGSWTASGCVFSSLQDTAYYAGDVIKDKMSSPRLGYGWRPPANYNEMVGAMSLYNGGGNANCGEPVPYSGPCPPPLGIDDPYAVSHFDSQHSSMYLIYCADRTKCTTPNPFTRDGAATAAKEYYLRGAGPY